MKTSKFFPHGLWVLAGFLVLLLGAHYLKTESPKSVGAFEQCQTAKKAVFNGKTLYTCTVLAVAERHRELVNRGARQAFLQKWLHKFDGTPALETEEGTLKAISEMVLSLKGRFDFVFTPSAVEQNEIIEKGQLAGIGASVAMPLSASERSNSQIRLPEHATPQLIALLKLDRARQTLIESDNPLVVIAEPDEGTPAFKGGMKKGDVIVKVGSEDVAGKSLDEVLNLIRGEPGTPVKLSVLRQGGKIELELIRAIVDLKTTSEKKLDDVGYLRISHFESMRVANDLHKSIDVLCGTTSTLKAESVADCAAKALIVDLRGNPGGRFDAVLLSSELLLEKGNLSSVMMRDGDKIVRSDFVLETDALVVKEAGNTAAHRRQFDLHFPLDRRIVVIVDEFSASGAEAMAGILQQQRGAVVVGAQTRGKGVGQCTIGLPYGYAANFICMEYLAGGKALDWVGITPDVVSKRDGTAATDSQLDLALRIARGEAVSVADANTLATYEGEIKAARQQAYEEEVKDTLKRFFR
jgi:C-terminal peptidase prc